MAAPRVAVEVDWARNGNWTDLVSTRRLSRAAWGGGSQYELGKIQPGRATFTCKNLDGSLDVSNTSSPFYPNVKPGREIRVRASTDGRTYDLWRGFIDEFPQRWQDGIAGWSDMTATDMLSKLAGLTLRACYQHEVLLDTPYAYYPLDEPSGSTGFGSVAEGQSWPAATIVNSKYGAGTVAFGTTGLPPVGDTGGTCVQLGGSGDAGGNQNKGSLLQVGDWKTGGPMVTTTSAGFAFECWFRLAAADATVDTYLVQQTSRFGGFNDYRIAIQAATGKLVFSPGNATITTTASYADNKPHHVVLSITSGGTATAYVDGVSVGTVASASYSDSTPGWLQLGGLITPFGTQSLGDYALQHIAIYTHGLSSARVAVHYTAGLNGFAGELSGARAGRLLDYAGWTGARQVDAGSSPMAPCDTAGKDALDALQDVALAELGAFYADGAGAAVFQGRKARYNAPIVATFGDDPAELHCRDDLEVGFDRTRLRNRWTVTIPTGASVTKADQPSRDEFTAGVWASEAEDLQLGLASEAEARAVWQLARGKDPRQRIRQVSPLPTTRPDGALWEATWHATLGARFGQRWRINRRPPGVVATAPMRFDVFVAAHEHSVGLSEPESGATDWQMTYQLASAEGFNDVFAFDDPVQGVLDAGHLVAL